MEETNKQNCENCEKCDSHGGCRGHRCWGHKYVWLRILLMVAILGITFCVGYKLGEFRGEFGYGSYGGGHGHGNMMYRGDFGERGMPMMYYWNKSVSPTSTSANTK